MNHPSAKELPGRESNVIRDVYIAYEANTNYLAVVDGVRGYSGWRWIFIIEGCITVVICIAFLFVFPTL